jgi:hypothetical protein
MLMKSCGGLSDVRLYMRTPFGGYAYTNARNSEGDRTNVAKGFSANSQKKPYTINSPPPKSYTNAQLFRQLLAYRLRQSTLACHVYFAYQ